MQNQKGFAPIILIAIVIAVLAVGGYFALKSRVAVAPTQSPTPSVSGTASLVPDGHLNILSPKENSTVGRSIAIEGYAYGWFEGTIAVRVYGPKNQKLFSGIITVPDNYEAPHYFTETINLDPTVVTGSGWIEFNQYSAKDGSLTYQKIIHLNFVGSTTTSSGISGRVMMGPTCPGPRTDSSSCDDKPYQGEFVVRTAGSYPKEVARFTTNNNGQFAVSLAPGNYTVEATTRVGIGATTQEVTVTANHVTELNFTIDTGIR